SDVSKRIANGTSVHVNTHTPVQNLNLDIEEQSHKHSISHIEEPNTNNSEGSLAGVLNEYLAVHREECAARCQAVSSVKYPIYDQTVYLNDYHKKMLKDQYEGLKKIEQITMDSASIETNM
ncbi:hypothetical protein ACJX0J_007631, partial [Zea mays]